MPKTLLAVNWRVSWILLLLAILVLLTCLFCCHIILPVHKKQKQKTTKTVTKKSQNRIPPNQSVNPLIWMWQLMEQLGVCVLLSFPRHLQNFSDGHCYQDFYQKFWEHFLSPTPHMLFVRKTICKYMSDILNSFKGIPIYTI